MEELITVIIPTYNRSHIVKRAIKSVFDQTYNNWELIVVDDASTDDTEEIIEEFKFDSRFKFIKALTNGGNAVARNLGVQAATGAYIAFVDSDDEYHPTYLEKAFTKLSNNKENASFLWAGTKSVAIDKSEVDKIWIPQQEKHSNQFLYQLKVGIGRGFLIKNECFEKLKFDENLRTAVDTDFLIRLRQKYDFVILEEIVITIHTQPESVRSDFSEKKKSYNIIMQKHKELINQDDFLRFKWNYKLLWLSLYDGDKKLAGKAYNKIKYSSLKANILILLFKILDRKTAVKIHKKFS